MELFQASHQWASRPNDERFLSLDDMQDHFDRVKERSHAMVRDNRSIAFEPIGDDNKGLQMHVRNLPVPVNPTNWAFGQVAGLAKAPAGYLRTLPAPLVADNLNYGLRFARDVEEVGLLTEGESLRCATGPQYGRIWNADIVRELRKRFGDGVTGDFKVPGEFGKDVPITKQNTTLYAGDRDCFIFLADERNRVEVPNRRNGASGLLARGFFTWNSEVGSATYGLGTFLFDFACMNRIVWGATEYKEVRIRHTSGAPSRFLDQVTPTIQALANGPTANLVKAIEAAQATKVQEDLDAFLARRFTKSLVEPIKAVHMAEEGRPIETLWDVTTGATAYARGLTHQDKRVAIERTAGEIMRLAA